MESSVPTGRMLAARRRIDDAVGAVVASAVLLLTALPIDSNDVGGLESTAFRWFNELPGVLFPFVWVVMQLGNVVVVPGAGLVAIIARRIRLALALAAAGSLVWMLAKVVKQMVPRGRPGELLVNLMLRDAPEAGNGYISGHAAVAFALVAVAFPYMGRWIRWVALTLAVLVCIGRVYVGAHLPLDVIGGAAFGWAIGSLVNLLVGIRTIGPEQPQSPP